MKKADLEKALRLALPGTEKLGGGGMDQVLFDREWLRSYNESLSVSYPLKTDVEIAVRAEEFYRILMKMSSEDVDVGVIEKRLVVSNKSTKLTLKPLLIGDYQKMKAKIMSLNVDSWSPVPNGFTEGLGLSMLSGLKDSRLGKISGVAFKENKIISTDNFKVGYYQMESGVSDELFRLRLSTVERLLKLGKSFEFVSINGYENNEQWLSLKSEDSMISSAHLMPVGDYPFDDILGVFDGIDDGQTQTYELPMGLEDALDRCEVLAWREDEDFKTLIRFRTEDGFLIVSSKHEYGEIEDRIPWDVELPHDIYVTPAWMKRILRIMRGFQISGQNLIFSSEKPKFKYLMLTKEEL